MIRFIKCISFRCYCCYSCCCCCYSFALMWFFLRTHTHTFSLYYSQYTGANPELIETVNEDEVKTEREKIQYMKKICSKIILHSNQYSICRTVVQCLAVCKCDEEKKNTNDIKVKTWKNKTWKKKKKSGNTCHYLQCTYQYAVEMWFSNNIHGISILINSLGYVHVLYKRIGECIQYPGSN